MWGRVTNPPVDRELLLLPLSLPVLLVSLLSLKKTKPVVGLIFIIRLLMIILLKVLVSVKDPDPVGSEINCRIRIRNYSFPDPTSSS